MLGKIHHMVVQGDGGLGQPLRTITQAEWLQSEPLIYRRTTASITYEIWKLLGNHGHLVYYAGSSLPSLYSGKLWNIQFTVSSSIVVTAKQLYAVSFLFNYSSMTNRPCRIFEPTLGQTVEISGLSLHDIWAAVSTGCREWLTSIRVLS